MSSRLSYAQMATPTRQLSYLTPAPIQSAVSSNVSVQKTFNIQSISAIRAQNKPTALSAILSSIDQEGFPFVRKEILLDGFNDYNSAIGAVDSAREYFEDEIRSIDSMHSDQDLITRISYKNKPLLNQYTLNYQSSFLGSDQLFSIYIKIYTYGLSTVDNKLFAEVYGL